MTSGGASAGGSPRPRPRVLSIPPAAPFLPTLVDALLTGRLVEGFAPGNDPLALASATIWVPTRRAARALATAFVSRLESDAALLPAIRTLGDGDDDDLENPDGDNMAGADNSALLPIYPSLDRHLVLAQLVHTWASSLNADQRAVFGGADILVPASLSDAVRFAADLARLMDQVATEESGWSGLAELVDKDHAQWWQLTVQFLAIATDQWPAILAERKGMDAAVARATRLRSAADRIRQNSGSGGPVIAAGSTGSIPATADLLKAIAHAPNGAVVLPGLDRDLDEETWARIDLPDNDIDDSGTAPAHPQYGLKRLLYALGVGRDEVVHLGGIDETSIGLARLRETLVSEALRPSSTTARWQTLFEKVSAAQRSDSFHTVSLIEADAEREEALAIAFALRETLEDPKKTAALVTPDRNLARRVAAEMRRFGVEVDDSAGQPLRNRPAGTFARLVLEFGFGQPDPVVLASLIKHPLAGFGRDADMARHAARVFELVLLRGALQTPQKGAFEAAFQKLQSAAADPQNRVQSAVRRLNDQDWQAGLWLARRLDEIFMPVDSETEHEADAPRLMQEHARTAIRWIEACGNTGTGSLKPLYGGEDGEALQAFLASVLDQNEALMVSPAECPDVFEALMASKVVRPSGGTHPRVSILGPLEVRLQTYDRIVLGGLNEKSWPAPAQNDPFLSRPMKTALGLPPPERRTGLAAHDFQVLLGMGDVVLTRALKSDNAPTVASRWVQRLVAIAGDEAARAMRKRGARFTVWASAVDQSKIMGASWPQPRPAPPVETRPRHLPVTDIETWVRDPYALYAKRILKLQPLDDLIRSPDAREKGTLFHDIFEAYVASTLDESARPVLQPDGSLRDPDDEFTRLITIARQHFAESALPADIQAMWWPRFETIARIFVDWHLDVMPLIASVHTERTGQIAVAGTGFTLSARADRIDVDHEDRIHVLDYKTGLNPKISDILAHRAPQLPLEAAIAHWGGFGPSLAREIAELAYIRLRPDSALKIDSITEQTKKSAGAADLADAAWERLIALIRSYDDPEKGYISKARFVSDSDWPSDYDHLARVAEWSTGDAGDAE